MIYNIECLKEGTGTIPESGHISSVRAALELTVYPKDRAILRSYISCSIPKTCELLLVSSSGMTEKGIIVLNSPGTIDSDYRGEVKVLLHNFGNFPINIHEGEIIANLILCRVSKIAWEKGRNMFTPHQNVPRDEFTVLVSTFGNGKVPSYQSVGASGVDLHANIINDVNIAPGSWENIPCGISLQTPHGTHAQIRSRSGLAAKNGVCVLGSPFIISESIENEIQIPIINLGKEIFVVTPDMRIAQLALVKTAMVNYVQAESLDVTSRGSMGFGSTGI